LPDAERILPHYLLSFPGCRRRFHRKLTAETERAKAQLKASILLSLDGTTAIAEDVGRQIVTTGRRMELNEIE